MIPINKSKVEFKYRIGFTRENPSKYDLLYEIASYLQLENKDEFNEAELKTKTLSRYNGSLDDNLQILISEGFIEKGTYTKYKLLKHLWM